MKFDPFNNRMCRDIRNQLSTGFLKAIRQRDTEQVGALGDRFLKMAVDQYQLEYIENRIKRYAEVLKLTAGRSFDDLYRITAYLWDNELFYEVHEYLEYHWKKASGDKKEILQALIRAAGAYVHLEQGRHAGAAKMAAKAVAVLEAANRQRLSEFLDLESLLVKLRTLDPVPPKLGRCDETMGERECD